MTRDEAIFELIKYRRRLEENPTIIFGRGSFDAEPFDMAVESLERKCGEWIAYNGDDPNWLRNDGSPVFMQCSECNTMVVNNFAFNWNYCPNCGADMRGDEDEIQGKK